MSLTLSLLLHIFLCCFFSLSVCLTCLRLLLYVCIAPCLTCPCLCALCPYCCIPVPLILFFLPFLLSLLLCSLSLFFCKDLSFYPFMSTTLYVCLLLVFGICLVYSVSLFLLCLPYFLYHVVVCFSTVQAAFTFCFCIFCCSSS
jgi:hypothetical protein